MEPQAVQQLTQLVQQMLQVLQQAGGGGGAPEQEEGGGDEAMPMNKMDDSDEDQQDQGMNPNAMQGGGDDEDDDEMGDDQSQGMGGASLHDRVSQLENHTGLKKAAAGSISDRLDALEQHWFGQEFEGEDGIPQVQVVQARVWQLEKAVGVPTKSTKPKTPAKQSSAPEVIPLDSLIKTAIAEAIAQTQQKSPQKTDLPSVSQMREEAKQFGKSRRSSHAVSSEEDLNKAAKAWGMEDDELDKPLGLGDALLLQYHAARNGYSLNLSDDGDSD